MEVDAEKALLLANAATWTRKPAPFTAIDERVLFLG
jgi:hypothetical protein